MQREFSYSLSYLILIFAFLASSVNSIYIIRGLIVDLITFSSIPSFVKILLSEFVVWKCSLSLGKTRFFHREMDCAG
jgi:hypothetical protein